MATAVSCLLCGASQHDPVNGYINHLVYQHGVMFGTEFLVESSMYKHREERLPALRTPTGKPYSSQVDAFCQTSDLVCASCTDKPEASIQEELNSHSNGCKSVNSFISCWQCPLCPMVYKRRYHFDHHIQSVHQLLPEEVTSTWQVSLTWEEFEEKQREAAASKVKKEPNEMEDKSPWGLNAFSTTFTCSLCNEHFKRDCDLKIHIRLVHRDESDSKVEQALEDISHSKLDGCVYQCKICGNKFNTSTSFMRHAKEIHGLGLKEYNLKYGSAEIISGVFQCKICRKSLKHTRNIITSHMKLVHQISWQEYHSRINENNAETVCRPLDERVQEETSSVVIFQCALCDSKVKLKRQHLDKAHSMDEEVYESFLLKGSNGDVKTLVDGAVLCKLCKKLSMDIKKHLKLSHKMMTVEQYDMIPSNEEEKDIDDVTRRKCYFGCDGQFKREIDLQVHIKLNHKDVSPKELAKMKKEAFEEIKPKSMSLECKICCSKLSGRKSFWTHLTRKHSINIQEYEIKYGKVDADVEPFKCNICSTELKYDQATIEGHLKNRHNMTWPQYKNFNETGILATNSPLKLECCKLCSASVRNLKTHLMHTHNMNMADYDVIDDIDSIRNTGSSPNSYKSNLLQTEVHMPTRVDIRDKTLKSCDTCDENFSTRRQFIEHCQLVHGMKFKLKSGESLPPPQVKRNVSRENSADKRIKLDFSH